MSAEDKFWEDLEIFAKGHPTQAVKVGVFEDAKYTDGTSVAFVARIQEFGSPADRIPARPFIRPTIAQNEEKWRKGVEFALKKGMPLADVLEHVGAEITGDIRITISKLREPPLSPVTIAKRIAKLKAGLPSGVSGIDKPLIDTGTLQQSITYQVQDVEE